MEVTLKEIKELIHFKYINGGGNKLAFYKLLNIQEKINFMNRKNN